MKNVKLVIDESPTDYNQIYQTVDTEFSFLTQKGNTFTELFPKVLCRDYLSDVIVAEKLGSVFTTDVYGFSLPKDIDKDKLKLSVSVPNKTAFKKVLRIIRDLEKSFNNLKYPMELYDTNHENDFVIVADKVWMSNPVVLNLFTLIIRCASYSTPKDYRKVESLFNYHTEAVGSNDSEYSIKISNLNLRLLLKNSEAIFDTTSVSGIALHKELPESIYNELPESIYNEGDYPTENLIDNIHNYSGIVSFARNVRSIIDNETTVGYVGVAWAEKYILMVEGLIKDVCFDSIPLGSLLTRSGYEYTLISATNNSSGAVFDNTTLEVEYYNDLSKFSRV